MAEVAAHVMYVSFLDAANRLSDWQFRIQSASAKAYVAAADDTARDATAVGIALDAVKAISLLEAKDYGVRYNFTDDAVVAPTDAEALRGNKVVFGYAGSGRNFVTSVPGRDTSVMTIVGGLNVTLEDGAAVEAFVDALETVGSDINGNSIVFQYAELND
jgi:hypothetical protein